MASAERPHASVSSLGTRPTVHGIEPLLEAHLFDFDGDLYGRAMRVEFVAKLRDEEKFDDLPALVRQMNIDAEQARHPPGRSGTYWSQCVMSHEPNKDYKHTITLPETEFPMRGDLPKREPGMLARWQKAGPVRAVARPMPRAVRCSCCTTARRMPTARSTSAMRSTRSSRTSWSSRSLLAGFDAPYVPGWDCHGLPIELAVEKKFGKVGDKLDAAAVPRRSAASTPTSRLPAQRRISSAWACWVTGKIRTAPWISNSRPT